MNNFLVDTALQTKTTDAQTTPTVEGVLEMLRLQREENLREVIVSALAAVAIN